MHWVPAPDQPFKLVEEKNRCIVISDRADNLRTAELIQRRIKYNQQPRIFQSSRGSEIQSTTPQFKQEGHSYKELKEFQYGRKCRLTVEGVVVRSRSVLMWFGVGILWALVDPSPPSDHIILSTPADKDRSSCFNPHLTSRVVLAAFLWISKKLFKGIKELLKNNDSTTSKTRDADIQRKGDFAVINSGFGDVHSLPQKALDRVFSHPFNVYERKAQEKNPEREEMDVDGLAALGHTRAVNIKFGFEEYPKSRFSLPASASSSTYVLSACTDRRRRTGNHTRSAPVTITSSIPLIYDLSKAKTPTRILPKTPGTPYSELEPYSEESLGIRGAPSHLSSANSDSTSEVSFSSRLCYSTQHLRRYAEVPVSAQGRAYNAIPGPSHIGAQVSRQHEIIHRPNVHASRAVSYSSPQKVTPELVQSRNSFDSSVLSTAPSTVSRIKSKARLSPFARHPSRTLTRLPSDLRLRATSLKRTPLSNDRSPDSCQFHLPNSRLFDSSILCILLILAFNITFVFASYLLLRMF
ncbi:hypothetical protein M422DRAFT_71495 [Sphaerobolus stellatus SS14]|uniref:Uncharacterized protein n=1 Tax=Sphaerobolus stellatus (strain SS14) TaxID=990650 RepID=A0A0C9TF75_SPHS4|nr:hypothetical protein M422DRAFT_71495 [Sphaerobolus stellatus SS14]